MQKSGASLSWGKIFKSPQQLLPMHWISESLPEGRPLLAHGMGRSYGDICLNSEGVLVDSLGLSRFISFDDQMGVLQCEAGVTLDDILRVIVPRGWFLPVTPGTKFVTVGGAIANDIHGKNHHRHGSIGNYIESFEILRSDGKRLTCDKNSNSEMFRASIGGMGLTGIILWAKMRLKKIQSAFLDVTTIKFQNLDEFISLASEKDAQFEYSVSWVDCGATGRDLGRGHMILGNHSGDDRLGFRIHSDPKYNIPFDFPNATLNALSVGLFNSAYYHRQRTKIKKTVQFYDPFFYPLDSVGLWNKIYGKRGFYQYQFVIPASEVSALRKCFELIATSKLASFLSVLKFFGSRKSEGLLSFPRPGLTLALDFPNQGEKTNNLFRQLDDLILKAGGRIYPAKDARMSSTLFQAMYPEWREFKKFMDPGFSSDFWKRISHES